MTEIIKESFSINDISIKLYGYTNGRSITKINNFIVENNIDISHFDNGVKNRKYIIIEKECPICGAKFKTKSNHKKEQVNCSIKCSNISRGSHSVDTKHKISKSIKNFIEINGPIGGGIKLPKSKKCIICGIIFEKWRTNKGRYTKSNTCSSECSHEIRSDNSKKVMKERIENGTHHGWQSRNLTSYPEKFFKKVLKDNNIKYEFNKPIKKRDIGIDCNSNYFLDFYIKEGNIDLEIDGKQHEYRQDSDTLRDKALTKNGYNVYRIKWKGINSENGKKYIKNEIDKFLIYISSP